MMAKIPVIENCLEVVATLEARNNTVYEAFKANNGSSNRSGVKLGRDYTRSLQARRLLQGYGFDGYMIKEETGCAMVCWQDRPLYSVSAWR
ncbi:hypothetical protein YC2023_071414 [Brassica napus]